MTGGYSNTADCRCGRGAHVPDEPMLCDGCGMPVEGCKCPLFCAACGKLLSEIPFAQGAGLDDHEQWHKEAERNRQKNDRLMFGPYFTKNQSRAMDKEMMKRLEKNEPE